MEFSSEMNVGLIDHMGNDNRIIQAARVSTLTDIIDIEDHKLIPYLMRERHGSPFEHVVFTWRIEAPIFVWREFMRHRMCLSGDSVISFSRPDNGRHYSYDNLARLYDNWHNPAQRARIKEMRIRSVDERTGEVIENRLVDIFKNNPKTVVEVLLEDGKRVKSSWDHKFFTTEGWMRAHELVVGQSYVIVSGIKNDVPEQFEVKPDSRNWKPIAGFEDRYEVSDGGEVRSTVDTHGNKIEPRIKKRTVNAQGYWCVSLSRHGISRMYTIHSLVANAFFGPGVEGSEVRHLDGNRLNCNIENLRWGTSSDNSEDMKNHGSINRIATDASRVVSIKEAGEEVTYDIAVEGPYHNFFANGIVVHNSSYNEQSGRYSVMPPKFYIPGPDRNLVQIGKTGNYEFVPGTPEQYEFLIESIKRNNETTYADYQERLDMGIAKEVSRMDLPLNMYSIAYVTMNARALMNFLSLRVKSDDSTFKSYPQQEINLVANLMEVNFKDLAPSTHAAFVKYGRVAP